MESSALALRRVPRTAARGPSSHSVPRRRTAQGHLAALHRLLEENEAGIDRGHRRRLRRASGDRDSPARALSGASEHPRRRGARREVDAPAAPIGRPTRLPGAKNSVVPQPLGVVGVLVPWNFPIQLSFGPLVDILAAGNHAMVKMSDQSGAPRAALDRGRPRYLPTEKVAFFEDLDEALRSRSSSIRPHALHRLERRRTRRHGFGGGEPVPGDAGTGWQGTRGGRPRFLDLHRRPAHLVGEVHELGPGVR